VLAIIRFNFIILSCATFCGCATWPAKSLFQEQDDFEILRIYDNDYGSRIELFLQLAKTELEDNYRQKKYLMIRGNEPPVIIHPRKDFALREIIQTAFDEQHITQDQKEEYLAECDQLYKIWEKHWRTADQKARRLGFQR
jgi:hypothetical protein